MFSAANEKNRIAGWDLNPRLYTIGNNQSPDDGARTRLAKRQGAAVRGKGLITRRPFRPIQQPEAGAFSDVLARGLHESAERRD
jgi:hypothetical protein